MQSPRGVGPGLQGLDGLDLEVESDEGEHQALEVLDEIVEAPEPVRVAGLVHVHEAAGVREGEGVVQVGVERVGVLGCTYG